MSTNFAVNAVTYIMCLAAQVATVRTLWNLRNHHTMKALQPNLLSACLLIHFTGASIYTFGQLFNITWEQLFIPFITCISCMFGVLFVMILRLYQAFVQTENKIRTAARLLDNNEELQISKLEDKTWLDRNLESTSRICLMGFLAFAEFALPFYAYIAFGGKDVWESPVSKLDSEFLAINLALGIGSTLIHNLELFLLVFLMRKKQKDISERVDKINNFFGLSIVAVPLTMLILYASPLARFSYEKFQFMPIVIYHIPLSFGSLYLRRKVLHFYKSSTQARLSRRTDHSTESSEAKQHTGIKSELVTVLNNSEGFKFMMGIAKKEFHVENILFYAAVSDWEALASSSEAKSQRLKDIMNVFCVPTATAPVNISHKSRMEMEIRAANADFADNFFEAAKQEVLNLMLWQTFVNVRKNPLITQIVSPA